MKIITMAFLLALVLSCSSRPYQAPEKSLDLNEVFFKLQVESLAQDKEILAAKRIFIYPFDQRWDTQDRQFQHFASYLYAALEDFGFTRTLNPGQADIIVLLSYSISYPQQHRTTFTVPFKTHIPHLQDYEGGKKTTALPVVENEEEGWWHPTMYRTETQIHTNFERTIFIQGVDMQRYRMNDGAEGETALWKTKITSTGPDENLPFVFPHLVAAAAQYIGKNTDGKIDLQIKAHDQKVMRLQEKVSLNKTYYFYDEKKNRSKELYSMPDSYPLKIREDEKPIYGAF
jgi:hypothetical protein